MSTEQECVDAHRAAVMAWAHRIPAVLASPDAARKLALGVVTELLATFTRKPLDLDVMGEIARLCGEAIYQAGDMSIGDVRTAAHFLGSKLWRAGFPAWHWEHRIPYEVCEALRRACEEDRVLRVGPTIPCPTCNGSGRSGTWGEGLCGRCRGTAGVQPPEPVTPPILALLLHDAAALLVDLRADVSGLESLVQEAEARERARAKGAEER